MNAATATARLIRPLRPRDPQEEHRVASPLELLTDLCFVVAIAQAALELHHAISADHLATGLVGFLMAFFAIYWAWLNFTWFASAYDNDDVAYRLLTIMQIVGVLVLAAGIHEVSEGHFATVVIGYVIMRVALVVQWLRASRHDPRRAVTCRRYAVGIVVVQLAWIGWVFAPHVAAIPLFLVLVAGELAVPFLAEKAGQTPWHPHHIAERYGLLFIIVLGETILSTTVAIQTASSETDVALGPLLLVVASGILIVFSVWWLYFARNAALVLGRLRGSNAEYLWGFGHYLIFAAAAAVGSGLAARVDYWTHEEHATALGSGLAVTVPVAVLLITTWAIQLRRHDPSMRTAGPFLGAAVIILASTWTPVPELVTGIVVAVLLAVEVRFASLGPTAAEH